MKIETKTPQEPINEENKKKRIIHSPNVVLVKGTFKGYTGYVVNTNPGTYELELDEMQEIGTGTTKKIKTIKDLKDLMDHNNVDYNGIRFSNRNDNDGVSLLQGKNYTVFEKDNARNIWGNSNYEDWDTLYKDWNWSTKGLYFDRRLTKEEKEYRTIIEENLNTMDTMDIDIDIEYDYKYIIEDQYYKPSQVKNIVIYKNGNDIQIGEIIKITKEEIIVKKFWINESEYNNKFNEETIKQANELNRKKIIDIEELIKEKTKTQETLREEIEMIEQQRKERFKEALEMNGDDEMYLRIILKKNEKTREYNQNEQEILTLNKRKDLLDISIFIPETYSEFLLEKVQSMLRKNQLDVLPKDIKWDDIEDNIRINTDNVSVMYSIVSEWGHKNIGKYDEIQIVNVIYKKKKKLVSVSGRNLEGSLKIGNSVTIKKGAYRNQTGKIIKKTTAYLNIHIDAIGREVSNHLDNYIDRPIYPSDVMFLDIYTKNQEYVQVIDVSVDENTFTVKRMDQLDKPDSFTITSNDIEMFGPGFRLATDKISKRKDKLVEYVNEESKETEETEETEELKEMDEYPEDLVEDLVENEEQEFKGAYSDKDRMFAEETILTAEQKKIISIIEKIKKIIGFNIDEYKVYLGIDEIVKTIKKQAGIWTDVDYKYITILMVLYYLIRTGDIDYIEMYTSKLFSIYNDKDTGSIFLKNSVFENVKVDRAYIKELKSQKDNRTIYDIIISNCNIVLQELLGTTIQIDKYNKKPATTQLVKMSETKQLRKLLINLSSVKSTYSISIYIDRTDNVLGIELSNNLKITREKLKNETLAQFAKNLNQILLRDSVIYIKAEKYQDLVDYIKANIKLKNIVKDSWEIIDNVSTVTGSLIRNIKEETGYASSFIRVNDYIFKTLVPSIFEIPYHINELMITNEYQWIIEELNNKYNNKYNMKQLPFIKNKNSEMEAIWKEMYYLLVEQYIANKMSISYSDILDQFKDTLNKTLLNKVMTKATTPEEKKQKKINVLVYYYVMINIKRLLLVSRESVVNFKLYTTTMQQLDKNSMLYKYLDAYLKTNGDQVVQSIRTYIVNTSKKIFSAMLNKILPLEKTYIQEYYNNINKNENKRKVSDKNELSK
jgi:hypothetical protein